jgi:hypothetical protein
VSWAGLFAPSTFFSGSVGSHWMKLCGTSGPLIPTQNRRKSSTNVPSLQLHLFDLRRNSAKGDFVVHVMAKPLH